MDKISYCRHRFPGIVIQQAVWLYFRFALSYRDDSRLITPETTPPSIPTTPATAPTW